jgi:MerR HTH family regulatory protein
MRKDLDKLCEEMRLRNERMQVKDAMQQQAGAATPEQKPLCANCKRRVCRRGSPLCSRCTYKGIQTQLRDTLPGAIKLDDVERKLDGQKTIAEEATDEVMQNFLYGEGSSDPEHKIEFDGLLQPEGDPELKRTTDDVYTNDEGTESSVVYTPGSHYTRKQVSQMVGVSPTTIIRWERKGATPLPKRFAHNNQLIYTDEIVAAIKEYASQIIVTQYVPLPPKTPQELAARGTTTRKTFKINKKLERAVAQRVSVTGFRGAGKLA